MLQWLAAALLFIACFTGCARTLTPARASCVATARSNAEAERLYHVAPFQQEQGELRREGDHWIWDALTSSGGHDLVSKVKFDEKGFVVGVDVRMLANPTQEPSKNVEHLPGWARDAALRKGIPEVMPK